MRPFYPEFEADINLLQLSSTDHLPTLKEVNSQFRKIALTTHPDREGGDSDRMKILSQAFQRLSTYISENTNCDKTDAEENKCMRDFFKKFNDIQYNTSSTTIFLENKRTEVWDSVSIWTI